MKLCKDCRWYHERKSESGYSISDTCLHPEVNHGNSSYVIDGNPDRARDCWIARQDTLNGFMPWRLERRSCGMAARYWEAK